MSDTPQYDLLIKQIGTISPEAERWSVAYRNLELQYNLADSFYQLVLKERDLERRRVENLEKTLARTKEALDYEQRKSVQK